MEIFMVNSWEKVGSSIGQETVTTGQMVYRNPGEDDQQRTSGVRTDFEHWAQWLTRKDEI